MEVDIDSLASIIVAMKDKMGMSMSFTPERCMQTVVPLIALLGLSMSIEGMTLELTAF